jgi:hypothetical protein
MRLTEEQQSLVDQPIPSKIFIQGRAGCGKTTAGVEWLRKLLKSGVPAHQILVFTPQRTLAQPYLEYMREAIEHTHSLITTMTLGSLARRMVDLFWPLISQESGFSHLNQSPHYLTLESAQYYMAHIVRPLIEHEGYFESLTINRNRIYAQILDNLNKAAIVGFPHQEIGARLKSAWIGNIEQFNIYEDVQRCADHFRQFCLAHNLLDFSLQVEVFLQHLWPLRLCRAYLTNTYRHLIADNLEEDTPVSHDVLRTWLPDFESAVLIADEDGGFRSFLGADVISAFALSAACDTHLWFNQNLENEPGVAQLKTGIESVIGRLQSRPIPAAERPTAVLRDALFMPGENIKLFPSMVQWVVQQVSDLVSAGTAPGQIVLLAPFMPDVLRFALGEALDAFGIPHQSHRPSRALRDEPPVQTLLTLAALAYPGWSMTPQRVNLALALMQSISGLDLVRAQLLANLVYDPGATDFSLKPFELVPIELKDRITYRVGERYDRLRSWLLQASLDEELHNLDFFLSRLFGEVLSQPGFGFHDDLESANTVSTLIESVQKFRWAVDQQLPEADFDVGKEYLQMVQNGVIAAQYIHSWEVRSPDAVFLAPAYTFLISNQPVDVQFWLDIGSPSWYQRLDQPLTHPYVLSRHWEPGKLWDSEDELGAAHETLRRLTIGLLNRCRKRVYIGMSALDIRGFENRGLLIRIINEAWQNSLREIS